MWEEQPLVELAAKRLGRAVQPLARARLKAPAALYGQDGLFGLSGEALFFLECGLLGPGTLHQWPRGALTLISRDAGLALKLPDGQLLDGLEASVAEALFERLASKTPPAPPPKAPEPAPTPPQRAPEPSPRAPEPSQVAPVTSQRAPETSQRAPETSQRAPETSQRAPEPSKPSRVPAPPPGLSAQVNPEDRVEVRWKDQEFEVSGQEFVEGIRAGRFGRRTRFRVHGGGFVILGDHPLYQTHRPATEPLAPAAPVKVFPWKYFFGALSFGLGLMLNLWVALVLGALGYVIGAAIGVVRQTNATLARRASEE